MTNMIYQLVSVENPKAIKGAFFVIENFPFPQFVTDEDGNTKTFEYYNDALKEADSCQNGFVIKI